jgi:lysophospholipase L1-like esterase
MKGLSRTRRAWLLIGCSVGVLGASSAPAIAAAPPPVTPGSNYLALGDSVTFGYEESAVVPAPDYSNAASFLGYPLHLAGTLHLKVADAACPGETSASLIDNKAQSLACENRLGSPGGYRTLYPLHVKYSGSQLAYAVSYLKSHKHTTLVSLMIGANDLFLCQEETSDGCVSEIGATLVKIGKNVKTILKTIRNKAHYRGQLVILNYYSTDYTNAFLTGVVKALNSTVDGAAKPFHVEVADGFGEFQAAVLHSGNNDCTAGVLTQLSTGGCGIHPSFAGQALLAEAVADAIVL